MDIQNGNLPVSYDAEQSVLGAILLKPDCFGDLINHVSADDFYIDEHREIFLAMYKLFSQSGNIDYVTVIEQLVNKGVMDGERAKQAITRILNAVPTAANATDYAKIVRDRALRRSLINICKDIGESAASETDSSEHLLEAAEKRIYSLSDSHISGDFRHIKDVIKEKINLDICFLSCKGIDSDGNLTDTSEEETMIRRAFLKKSRPCPFAGADIRRFTLCATTAKNPTISPLPSTTPRTSSTSATPTAP